MPNNAQTPRIFSLHDDLRSDDPRVRRSAHFRNRMVWFSAQLLVAMLVGWFVSTACRVAMAFTRAFFPEISCSCPIFGESFFLWTLGALLLFACLARSFRLMAVFERALRDGSKQVYASTPDPDRTALAVLVDRHFVALFWFETVVVFFNPITLFGFFLLAASAWLSSAAPFEAVLHRAFFLAAVEGVFWCLVVARLVRIRRRVRLALGVGLGWRERLRTLRWLWRCRENFLMFALICGGLILSFALPFVLLWAILPGYIPFHGKVGDWRDILVIVWAIPCVGVIPYLLNRPIRKLQEAGMRRRLQAVRDGDPDEDPEVFLLAGAYHELGGYPSPLEQQTGIMGLATGSYAANRRMGQPDFAAASALYREGAERGDPVSMFALARLLERGAPGVPIDFEEASELLRRSASLGHRPAVERIH